MPLMQPVFVRLPIAASVPDVSVPVEQQLVAISCDLPPTDLSHHEAARWYQAHAEIFADALKSSVPQGFISALLVELLRAEENIRAVSFDALQERKMKDRT